MKKQNRIVGGVIILLLSVSSGFSQNVFPSTGNVGIGTSTPANKLDVIGGQVRVRNSNNIAFSTSADDGLGASIQSGVIGGDVTPAANHLSIYAHNILYNGTQWLRRNPYSAAWAMVMNTDYCDFQYAPANPGGGYAAPVSPSAYIRITSNGNVGIGTTNPGSFKLAVEGKIGAREIVVTSTNPWPDYVFNNGYNLMTIDSLDKYLKINNHLPNIPSAKEIQEKGGIELGDMTTKLLEKVEELTLYIIQSKRENEEVKRKLELLRNNNL